MTFVVKLIRDVLANKKKEEQINQNESDIEDFKMFRLLRQHIIDEASEIHSSNVTTSLRSTQMIYWKDGEKSITKLELLNWAHLDGLREWTQPE